MSPEFLAALSKSIPLLILLFSVIIHEVMHGLVAKKFGDNTADRAGRLTLNPLPHIDPIGTILMPLIFIFSQSGIILGWAKPVPVNPLNFSNIRKGELFVSAAGVLANFGLAAVCALAFHIFNSLPYVFPELIGGLLLFGVRINLFLGVFNLLPIPPLDGSKVLLSQLPYNLAKEYQKVERYGFILLLFLVFIFPGPLFLLLNFLVSILSSMLGF